MQILTACEFYGEGGWKGMAGFEGLILIVGGLAVLEEGGGTDIQLLENERVKCRYIKSHC